MTGTYHHAQIFSIEMGSCQLVFLPRLDWNYDPPISTHIARMAGIHNCTQLLVEIGSCELFAQLGLEPQSSISQSSIKLELQARATGIKLFFSLSVGGGYVGDGTRV
jgi:hypothetical protein